MPRLIIAPNKSFLVQISMIIGVGQWRWCMASCLCRRTEVLWQSRALVSTLYWCPLVLWWHKRCPSPVSVLRQAGHNGYCIGIIGSWSVFPNLSDKSLSDVAAAAFMSRPAKCSEMGAVIIAPEMLKAEKFYKYKNTKKIIFYVEYLKLWSKMGAVIIAAEMLKWQI